MRPKSGYIAIATLLVITVLVTLVGSAVSILGVDEAITSLSYKKGLETLDLVDSCAEDAALRISESGSIPPSVILPELTCSVSNTSTVGLLRRFTLSGTLENHFRRISLEFSRGLVGKINLWAEN